MDCGSANASEPYLDITTLGFKSFAAPQDTRAWIELMHMIKKRALVVEEGDEGLTAPELFYALAV
jgi:hypothetical protein